MSILSSTSTSTLGSLLNTTSSTAAISVNGLISGLDTSKVIQGLLAIEQQKIDNITARKTSLQAEQTAFKGIEAKLLALQTQMFSLARGQNGVFDARTAQVSDPAALSPAASSSAAAGDYHLRINNLALASQVASQGFDTSSSTITHGTLTIRTGNAATTITIDGTNDTLQGLANAINASGAAVSASVLNDGSGEGREGYRLLLTSKATGIANQITITNNLANTGGGAARPIFDAGAIGDARLADGATSTSTIQANAGPGYTGSSNNTYTFTVIQGGTVGSDDGLQIQFADTTGTHTGTITINQGDVDVLKQVAQGLNIQFGAGTLVAGEKFVVKAFAPTVQAAADASITLGSGAGAFTITSASNQIDSLIPGVALSLRQADPAKDITLTVANDVSGITNAIQGFVSAYNDLVGFIGQVTRFDNNSKQGGILLGNLQVISIEQKIRAALGNVVTGANPRLNHLGALGISTGDNGQLSVNSAKLANILNGTQAGVTLADVRTLFALTGASSNQSVPFVSGSEKTRASSTPYTVNITQAAVKAALTAGTALSASTVVDNTNNTLVVSIDGATSSTLTLAGGTYTRSALAQALQAAINGDTSLSGRQVSVSVAGDALSITSNTYGTTSRVGVMSGPALDALGFTAGASAQGSDVVGNYVVNGNIESAHGNGQFLIGDSANVNTADLQVRVNLSASQVGGGIQANVTVTRGIASQLTKVLGGLFDLVNGRLKSIDDGYTSALQRLDVDKARVAAYMTTRQQQLQNQFNAMEKTLSQLQSAGNLLAQQAQNLTQKK